MKKLIYLEDAIDAICKKCKADYPDTSACDICDDISVLKSLPSAEPERKTGRWTGVGHYDEGCKHHLWYACNKCGYQTTWHMKPVFNYCPNCGADMRGEK